MIFGLEENRYFIKQKWIFIDVSVDFIARIHSVSHVSLTF